MKTPVTVFKTDWFHIEEESYQDQASMGSAPYYRIKSADGVIILALTEESQIILVKQFRPALNKYTLEFPSGSIDEGETATQAASRELLEETGYVCQKLNCLSKGHVMMNRFDSFDYAFYGRNAKLNTDYKIKEDISVVLVDKSKFKSMLLSGDFQQFTAFAPLVLADLKYKVGLLF